MLNPIANRIERYMDVLSVRQRVTASNIANADTPGYRTRDVDFASAPAETANSSTPVITEPKGLVVKNDGNNVSLDRESRLLAENAMRFQIASQMMAGQIKNVRTAIQEGHGS